LTAPGYLLELSLEQIERERLPYKI